MIPQLESILDPAKLSLVPTEDLRAWTTLIGTLTGHEMHAIHAELMRRGGEDAQAQAEQERKAFLKKQKRFQKPKR